MAPTKTKVEPERPPPQPVAEAVPVQASLIQVTPAVNAEAAEAELPRANGLPGVQRAAGLVAPDRSGPERARLAAAMQGAVGNSRTGAMLGVSDRTGPSVESAAPAPAAASEDTATARAVEPGAAPARAMEETPAVENAAAAAVEAPAAAAATVAETPKPAAEEISAAPAHEAPAAAPQEVPAGAGEELPSPAVEETAAPLAGGAPAVPGRPANPVAGPPEVTEPAPAEDVAAEAPAEGGAAAAGLDAAGTPAGAGGGSAAAAAAPPEAAGAVVPDAGVGAEPEAGGDEESAADELEEKLEAAAPAEGEDAADDTAGGAEEGAVEEADLPPEPVAAPEPGPAPPTAGGDVEGSAEPPASAEPPIPAAPAGPAAPAEPVEVPEASEPAVDAESLGALESEPAALTPAEVDVATTSMAEGPEAAVGGGGGGGTALPEPPAPEPPRVAGLDPEAALATAGSASPAQLAAALGGVRESVGATVGQQRDDLAAHPPTLERPAGRGAGGATRPAEPPRPTGQATVDKAPEGQASTTPAPAPLPAPPPLPVAAAREPAVDATPEGTLTEADAARIQGAVDDLPTTDPALHVTAGPAPQVALDGNTDPARADEQRANLRAGADAAAQEGRADVTADMGENAIHDEQPARTLTASVGRAGGGPGDGAGGTEGAPTAEAEAASIIAGQEKGGEIAAAVVAAKAEMAAKREEHATQVEQEKERSGAEIAGLEQANAEEQDAVRRGAKAEVTAKRREWTAEQQATVAAADKEADEKVAEGRKEVDEEKRAADVTAQAEIAKGNAEAEQERVTAEREAAQKKTEAEQESSGVLGWLASKAKAFFNKIKSAITKAFDLARQAVRAAIDKAKELAAKAIEAARQAIVSAIKAVGDALIAIGDRLLKHFPVLREKFRNAITSVVDDAVATVNKLAEELNAAIQKALDAYGAALDAALGFLEKGLLAAVDAVGAAVEGALRFANSVVQALAAFAVLVKDVSSGPVQWLQNLGAAVVDGIRNHLWGAFKSAVSEWFTSKVEQVLGLGAAVWKVLTGGGLSVAQIGKMAWEGIKSIIPMAVVRILVEKLVSMIVPAAGAVMVIIEGLQAAWGTVSRILAAFSKFMEFLRAVRSGNAGPPFAAALAAAAVAVIDFIANWLIAKLAKGAVKVAGKLKGIAKRLLGKKRGKAAKKAATPKLNRRRRRGTEPTKARGGKRAKGEPKKDRDKRRDAERRLGRASRHVTRALAHGISSANLRALANATRTRFKLKRADVYEDGDDARIVLIANPEDAPKAKKSLNGIESYRQRAEKFYDLMGYYDLHHVYSKEASIAVWWKILGIDHDAPENMLEIPLLLHQQGVHKASKKLKTGQALREQAALVLKGEYEWNAAWKIWWQREGGRVDLAQLSSSPSLRDRVRVRAQRMASALIRIWSRKLGVDLALFRLGSSGPDTYRSRYKAELDELLATLRASKASRKATIEAVRKFSEGKVQELREEWKLKKG